jgi:Uma2 family endonuclease
MTQAALKLMSFEEFLQWHPDDGRIFELYQGVPVELNSTGTHEKITGFLDGVLFSEIQKHQYSCFIPKTATVKPYREQTGYKLDVIVLDELALANEPDWERRSTLYHGASTRLVIEVASTNWRDDDYLKFSDYEDLGIREYWIVDYLGLASRKLIGEQKLPTVTIYQLIGGEYQSSQFRGDDPIVSSAFPALQLTAGEIFEAKRCV